MITIRLTQGYVALIDDEDAELTTGKWSIHKPKKGGVYARRMTEGKMVMLHRVIGARMGLSMDTSIAVIDHKNGDSLDCRRENLRSVSWKENSRNIKTICRNNTSGYLGVSFFKPTGRWRAYIGHDQKVEVIGWFDTAREAHAARLEREKELWGIQPQRVEAHAATTK